MNNSRNKKILLVTRPLSPPWDEASKNFVYNLAMNIGAADFELHLMTNSIQPSMPAGIKQDLVYDSNRWNFSQKLRSLMYQFRHRASFGIVHYFFTPAALSSFVIKTFIKNDKVKTVQTIATLREDLFSGMGIKNLMFADQIVTYSDYAKNKLNSLGLNNVERVYPGIDLEYYSPAPKNIKLMSNWKISASDFVITYPGEYTRLGATDDIVGSLPQIFGCVPGAKFIFACRIKNKDDSKKKEEIKNKLKNDGFLDKIVFTDTYDDMEKLYNLSDVVIFPARDMKGKFDVPLAVIEAMACGKPVIISNIPILREFANEKNSVIIEAGDIGQLKNSILDLYRDKNRRAEVGKNARAFAEENFDIKKTAEKYGEIYKKLQ